VERMKETPVVGSVLHLLDTYPRVSAWVVLSVGIVALLIYEARDVGLSAGNWAALIIASVIVAGLCIWIVSWEDDDENAEAPVVVKSEVSPAQATAPDAPTEKLDS